MKKIFLAVLMILLFGVSGAMAAELKVGDKAPDFSLSDSLGKVFNFNTPVLKDKVISFLYTDYSNKDLNVHVEDALRTEPGLDREHGYKGLGVVNMKGSWVPNAVLKMGIESKQKKNPQAIILMDTDYTLLNLWGLQNKNSNMIVLDKNRICRYIYKGKLPSEEVSKLIKIIKEYQSK